VLPQLSDILVLARDPVVLAAYAIAALKHRLPTNRYVVCLVALTFLWTIATMLLGHANLTVALYGVRANFLHIPFAFIMGNVFYRSDLIHIGRWWLVATLLMTVIIVLQYLQPQDAYINRSVGGSEGGGFSGARGRYRPPGTFSFIVGVVWFYTLSTAFLVSGVMQHKRYPKWLLASSAMAILIAVPVSISRSLILAVGLTLVIGVFTSTFQKNTLFRFLRLAAFACVALLIANQFEVFEDARKTFLDRWETANEHSEEGFKTSVLERILNEFTGPFTELNDVPFVGLGIGAGTIFGAKVMHDERTFTLGVSEWHRLMGEGGLLFGGLFIAWRLWLGTRLGLYAWRALKKGNGMGLIFLSATLYNLWVGQWGQSTIQGFTVVGISMTICAMRPRPERTKEQKGDPNPTT